MLDRQETAEAMPGLFRSLPRPLKFILASAIAVVFYGLFTWLIAASQGIQQPPLTVKIRGVPLPFLDPLATASALLALGTVALAYSAFFQGQVSRLEFESTERKRIGDLRPYLYLQITEGQGGSVYPDMFTIPAENSTIWLGLRNLGPGNAVEVTLKAYDWRLGVLDIPSSGKIEGADLGPKMDPPGMFPRDVIGHPISLAVNELFTVPFQFRIPPLQDYRGARPESATSFSEQVLWLVNGKDVEGRDTMGLRVAIRLVVILPATDPSGKTLRNYKTVWRLLTASQAQKIPLDE